MKENPFIHSISLGSHAEKDIVMSRNALAFLLLLSLILHGAAVGLCADGTFPHGHGSIPPCPHFHIHWLGLHNHNDSGEVGNQPSTSRELTLEFQSPAGEQDEDAIYLSLLEALSGDDSLSQWSLLHLPVDTVLDRSQIRDCLSNLPQASPLPFHHPCPVYLRTLALVI